MKQADYDLKPYVTPTISVQVTAATFADGSSWKAK